MRELELIFSVKLGDIQKVYNEITNATGTKISKFCQLNSYYDFDDEWCAKNRIYNRIRLSYDIAGIVPRFVIGEYSVSVSKINNGIEDRRELIKELSMDLPYFELIKNKILNNGMQLRLRLCKDREEFSFAGLIIEIDTKIQFDYKDYNYILNPTVQLSFEPKHNLGLEINKKKKYITQIYQDFFERYAFTKGLTYFDRLDMMVKHRIYKEE